MEYEKEDYEESGDDKRDCGGTWTVQKHGFKGPQRTIRSEEDKGTRPSKSEADELQIAR